MSSTGRSIDMSAVHRLLIIKMSAMGDVVHALPVSAALGRAFPHVQISWIVEEPFAPLLTGNPYLHEVLTLTKARGRHMRSLGLHREYARRLAMVHARRFDLTIDLQGLTKSALVAVASRAPIRLGYHWLREAAGLVERRVPRRPESVHVVDQYLDVARFLGAECSGPEFPFVVPPAELAAARAMLQDAGIGDGEPFVSLNPASAAVRKQWGEARYAALARTLRERHGLRTVMVTADRAAAAAVARQAPESLADLSGRTSLKQLAAVLQCSAAHVCGDTGSGHLAAALGVPVVGIFGPTDVDRVAPYGQAQNALAHKDVCGAACRQRRCEFAAPRCLAAIGVYEVEMKVAAALAAARAPAQDHEVAAGGDVPTGPTGRRYP